MTKAITDATHTPVGSVRAIFSLAKVNASIADSTRRTTWTCCLVALGTAGVLLLAIGRSLLRPLREMRMARELEIASDIQRAMLPTSPEHADFEFAGRMVAADEVGGDFFDVRSAGDSLWITVGDVSGHGLPAGLVMMMTQAAFAAHFLAAPDERPDIVYRAVNELLWENVAQRLRDNKYVTCQLLAYRGAGVFGVVGGHQALLVYRAASHDVEIVEVRGPWMGIARSLPECPTHALYLAPGDVLCLYSDGVIEARDPAGACYDLPRLRKLLAGSLAETRNLDAVLDRVFSDVLSFCGKPQDDASFLVVRRKGLDEV